MAVTRGAIMDLFEYEFMQRAFLVGTLLALIVPCIGVIVVLKRLSMMSDALAHNSLAGVAAGLMSGINPIFGAVIMCILSALAIEVIRKHLPRYSEISIAIVMSAGIGLAGLLSGLVKSSANFNSFLFGSIVAISNFELYLVIGISFLVLLFFCLLYRELYYIALDERSARLAGIPVNWVNFIFTILTALTVSIAARTVGTLVVSSLMILPVACALQIGKSYKQVVGLGIVFALLFTSIGLTLSFYGGLKPGATIVLAGVMGLILILFSKK